MTKDMFGEQKAESPWTSTAKPGTSPVEKSTPQTFDATHPNYWKREMNTDRANFTSGAKDQSLRSDRRSSNRTMRKITAHLNKSTEVVKGLYDRIPWNPKPGGGQESFHEGTKRSLKEGNKNVTAQRASYTTRSRADRKHEPKGWEKQDVGRGMQNLTKMVRELTTEVEKAYAHAGKPWSQKPGQQGVGRLVHGWRNSEKQERKYHEPQREREATRTIERNTGQVEKATRQQDVGSHTRRTTIPSTRKQVASHVREHGMSRDQHNYPRDHEIRMEANRGRVANLGSVKKATRVVKGLTGIIKAMTAGSSSSTGSNLMHAVADGAKPMDKAMHSKTARGNIAGYGGREAWSRQPGKTQRESSNARHLTGVRQFTGKRDTRKFERLTR